MRFVSTRGQAPPTTLTEALRNGAAPDGGLYMPQELPAANLAELDPKAPLAEFAASLLRPFFAGDALMSARLFLVGALATFDRLRKRPAAWKEDAERYRPPVADSFPLMVRCSPRTPLEGFSDRVTASLEPRGTQIANSLRSGQAVE